MKDIKMFSFDLDGTLLNDHKVISESTIQDLLEYQEKGYRITLASGRYYKEVERFAKQLKLDEYNGYAVCGNGYEVIDIKNNTKHYFELIDSEIAKDVIHIANKHHLMQYVKINGTYYLSTNALEKIVMNGATKLSKVALKAGIKQLTYASHMLEESIFSKDLTQFIQDGLVKMCVIGTFSQQKKWIEEISNKYPNYFSFYPINPFSLEITHNSVSKKNAVSYICETNGFTLDNVMAFGDSGNDEPLLLTCGIGVTMKNGTKRALKKAKIVSDYSNHEDGAIKMIHKYLKAED